MANADLPEEEERLAGMITAAGWSTTTEVANDTFAVLRAGLDSPQGRPWGVAVTCGAGINCVGVPDGRTTGFLALGGITGDWGGTPGPTAPGPTAPGPTAPGPTAPGPTSHTGPSRPRFTRMVRRTGQTPRKNARSKT